MKILIILLFVLLSFIAQAGDTIYVKKVYVGKLSVKVRSGYIIKKNDSLYMVNGHELKLKFYKPTNNKNYEPKSPETGRPTQKSAGGF